MFATLFLPSNLPTEPEEFAREDILRLINESSSLFPKNLTHVVELFCDFHKSKMDAWMVHDKMKGLSSSGDYFGFYLEAQNSMLLVERISDEKAVVSAWEVQASNLAVMSNVHSMTQNLPRKSLTVSFSVLVNFACCEQIAGLIKIEHPKAASKSNKRGEVEENRDVKNPMYVFDEFLNSLGGNDYNYVDVKDKKMSDEVRYSNGAMPWRREPIWAAFKSIMHVIFARENKKVDDEKQFNDEARGGMYYKSCILQILMKALDNSIDNSIGFQSQTSLDEAGKKLARRFDKFEKKYSNLGNYEKDYLCLKRKMLTLGEKLQKALQNKIGKMQSLGIENNVAEVMQVTDNDILIGLEHSLTACGSILKQTLQQGSRGDGVVNAKLVKNPKETRLHFKHLRSSVTMHSTFTSLAQTISEINCNIESRDTIGLFNCVEDKVIELWNVVNCNTFASAEMSDALLLLLENYMNFGLSHLKDELLVISRVLLISTCLTLLLDRIAVNNHSMVKDYKCGIKMECLYKLLLKDKKFLDLLHAMETYVKDRDDNAVYLTTCFDPNIDRQSFSVRFAQSDPGMCAMRQTIQRCCSDNQERKKVETRENMERYRSLTEESTSLSCTYIQRRKWIRGKWHNYSDHYSSSCRKCSLEKQADDVKMNWYEKLLPDNFNCQWAVVFELGQPVDLSCARDAYYMLAEKLFGGNAVGDASDCHVWKMDRGLSCYNRSRTSHIQLASTTKKSTSSHYYRTAHVREGYSDEFIVSHGFNTYLMANGAKLNSIDSWKWDTSAHCTVKLNGNYKTLEKFVDCKEKNVEEFSENEVIASQCEANINISINEYLTIGKLRTGQSKQLVHLARALDQRIVSFDQKNVVTIISTLLHKAGKPMCTNKQLAIDHDVCLRESFAVLGDYIFLSDLCNKVLSLIDNCKSNWAKYNNLLNAVYILVCLIEKGPLIKHDEAASALKHAREVVQTWVEVIRSKKSQAEDFIQKQNFMEMIVLTCAIGRLTFGNNDILLSENDDVDKWLYFSAYMYDNMSDNEFKCNTWERSLIVESQFVAESISERLRVLIHQDTTALCQFTKKYWPSSCRGTFEGWFYCNSEQWNSNWYRSMFVNSGGRESMIHINIIDGSFLVNGKPCSNLPKVITKNSTFNRWFGKTIVDVKPDDEGGYITDTPLRGVHYLFRDRQVAPTIIQRRGSKEYVLIPHESLEGDFPHKLVHDYSHWLNVNGPNSGVVYFCSKFFKDIGSERDALESNAAYCLERNKFVLDRKKSNEVKKVHLVDPGSDVMNGLHERLLKRISPLKHIHFSCERLEEDITNKFIEFPKLMNFRLEVSNGIFEHKLTGLKIAINQNFGTLNGLEHVLLLEGPEEDKKMVIIPHSSAMRRNSGKISIDTENLKSPPFFQYILDKELRCLKAQSDRVSSIYLAQLHILTSSCIDDTFTYRTGSSQAFEILRSGHCCGNLIISLDITDEEIKSSLAILIDIAKVSLQRTFYPTEKQVMESNDIAESTFSEYSICHDAYAFLTHLRIKEFTSELSKVGKQIPKELENEISTVMKNRTDSLSERAYWRRRERYAKDTLLRENEEVAIFGRDIMSSIPGKKYAIPSSGFDLQTVTWFRQTGFSAQHNIPLGNGLTVMNFKRYGDLAWSSAIKLVDKFYKTDGWSVTKWARYLTESDDDDCGKPFKDIFIALYYLCTLSEVKRCPKVSSRFRFLVTKLQGVNFKNTNDADKSNDLKSLLAIFQMPLNSSPPALCYMTESIISRPNEMDWRESDILCKIDSHLEQFAESEPVPESWQGYDNEQFTRRYNGWQERKNLHDKTAKDSKSLILDYARRQWYRGDTLIYSHAQKSKINDPQILVSSINGTFRRWRIAKAVENFFEELRQYVAKIKIGMDKSSVLNEATNINNTSNRSDINEPFQSVTSKNLTSMSVDTEDFIAYEYSETIDESQGSSAMKVDIDRELSQIDILGKEYEILVSEFKEKLKFSWELASKKKKISYHLNEGKISKVRADLLQYESSARSVAESLYNAIKQQLYPHDVLQMFGLWDAVTPYTLLRRLGQHLAPNNKYVLNEFEKDTLIKYGRSVKHVQRAQRCLRLLRKGVNFSIHLMKELIDCGNKNWDTSHNVEYLLFEVDNNLCIREFQAEVVEQICSDKEDNRLLQVNMGEGKSSVIAPLSLVRLARGDRLARGTVLSSLYKINAMDWQSKVGGLLGRRILPMMCRRDLDITPSVGEKILSTCQYAKDNGHIILTVPENRLSLENKAIELASRDAERYNLRASHELHKALNYMKCHCRDILDECDLILSPKNQLLYTLGTPVNFDGHEIRWALPAACLSTIGRIALELKREFSKKAVEILEDNTDDSVYPGFRLLDSSYKESVMNKIKKEVFDDIVYNVTASYIHSLVKPNLEGDELVDFENFVKNDKILDAEIFSKLPKDLHSVALILRGYLAYDVLESILMKRWRVNYGAHPTRKKYQMAVPFQAKDVASERTEFGHPDVALSLTYSHYYNEGLTNAQLMDVFRYMHRMNVSEAKAIYSKWIDIISRESLKPHDIQSYECVNLEDGDLFNNKLYPAFHKHMLVIYFWLSRLIFPIQAKQFPKKVTSTSWDLCPAGQIVTTGFSGTDDLENVLPLTIKSLNMKSLEETNGVQLENLLRNENDNYHALESENATQEILEYVTDNQVDVILEPGALVLHMSNRSFAIEWLKRRKDKSAVVYFDSSNNVMVLTHDGGPTKFGVSPYVWDMSDCLLYLDDIHTRGSDFKLPIDARAVLTLGKGLPKDKFLQACMRMRQLGKGQSLSFIASSEVHTILNETFFGKDDTNNCSGLDYISGILNWTISNTIKTIMDLIPYNMQQACNHITKVDSYNQWHNQRRDESGLEQLARSIVEDEILKLNVLYGHSREEELLPVLVAKHMHIIEKRTASKSAHTMTQKMKKHVQLIAPNAFRMVNMFDEEQERELEQELEDEREMSRPPKAEAAFHKFSPGLHEFANGQLTISVNSRFDGFFSLENALSETTFAKEGRLHELFSYFNSSMKVFATLDFKKTIKCTHVPTDMYLKIPEWFLCYKDILVIISNFEANQLFHIKPRFYPQENDKPCLYPFSSIVRLGQPQQFLSKVQIKIPPVIHIFSGSIHITDTMLDNKVPAPIFSMVRNYLGISTGNRLDYHNKYLVERDGFVPKHSDRIIIIKSEILKSLEHLYEEIHLNHVVKDIICDYPCTCSSSPIEFLRDFFCISRHLEHELKTSPIGILLSVKSLKSEGCLDNKS